jgi:hypothetical protein
MGKINISIRRDVLKELRVQAEERDPSIILNIMYHGRQGYENPPFYISLGINGFYLNNCMLDSIALENVIYLKVMKQLSLKTTSLMEMFSALT